MAELRLGAGPFFERGIERVVDAPPSPDALVLPDAPALAPAQLARTQALEALLHADNLEAMLEAWVQPALVEREMLAPRRFRAAIESVRARLRRLAQPGGGTDARTAAMLERAACELDHALALRELLQMYRNALVQG
jgi:hypothetical protein